MSKDELYGELTNLIRRYRDAFPGQIASSVLQFFRKKNSVVLVEDVERAKKRIGAYLDSWVMTRFGFSLHDYELADLGDGVLAAIKKEEGPSEAAKARAALGRIGSSLNIKIYPGSDGRKGGVMTDRDCWSPDMEDWSPEQREADFPRREAEAMRMSCTPEGQAEAARRFAEVRRSWEEHPIPQTTEAVIPEKKELHA